MYKFIEAIAWIALFEIGLFTIGIVIIHLCIAYAIRNKKQKNQSNETV